MAIHESQSRTSLPNPNISQMFDKSFHPIEQSYSLSDVLWTVLRGWLLVRPKNVLQASVIVCNPVVMPSFINGAILHRSSRPSLMKLATTQAD